MESNPVQSTKLRLLMGASILDFPQFIDKTQKGKLN